MTSPIVCRVCGAVGHDDGKPRVVCEACWERVERDAELGRLVRALPAYESVHQTGQGRWLVFSRGAPVSHVTYETPEEALRAWAQDNAKTEGLMKGGESAEDKLA
jgi:hypothetical protein